MVAGLGVCLILIGVMLQITQVIVSILQKDRLKETSGDAWYGRSLEWSVSSPPPMYNFAVIPHVYGHDPFWATKHDGEQLAVVYSDIIMPKNSGLGVYLGATSLIFGFGLVWHMWWLALLGALFTILCIAARAFNERTEYVLTAEQVARIEKKYAH